MNIRITILPSLDPEHTLAGTFMTDAPVDEVYLFLYTPAIVAGHPFILPSAIESHYWSVDKDGSSRLDQDLLDNYGLPKILHVMELDGLILSPEEP